MTLPFLLFIAEPNIALNLY